MVYGGIEEATGIRTEKPPSKEKNGFHRMHCLISYCISLCYLISQNIMGT